MIREYTNKLFDLIEMDLIDTQKLAEQLLMHMSEDDVKEFWYTYAYDDYNGELEKNKKRVDF